jgi:hypothetical protein
MAHDPPNRVLLTPVVYERAAIRRSDRKAYCGFIGPRLMDLDPQQGVSVTVSLRRHSHNRTSKPKESFRLARPH